MNIPVFQIDAFTDQPFSGNPAAVCPLNEWLPDETMQVIAAEMNLSETAFFIRRSSGTNEFDLRWFTPTVEVDLCGHATLAAGSVVLSEMLEDHDSVRFHTRSGWLGVKRDGDRFQLDFPSNPPTSLADEIELSAVSAALGAEPTEVLTANTTVAVFETETQVSNLKPDFEAVKKLNEPWVAATAPSDSPKFDFVSRFFVPTAGIDEDPVTGSSHTILAPYWSQRLRKRELIARQISQRGGTLYCTMAGDRVLISGHVVKVLTGSLTIDL